MSLLGWLRDRLTRGVRHHVAKVCDRFGLGVNGHITIKTWDARMLRRRVKSWPTLTKQEQFEIVRELDDEYATTVTRTTNIPLDGLLGFIAKSLNPKSTETAEASFLAIGTGTVEPVPTNTSLTDEVYRTAVGDAEVDGSDLLTSTFLSQAEANGYTISEIGLAGGDVGSDEPTLTHALLTPERYIEKNSRMVVTIDYVLEIRRPSA